MLGVVGPSFHAHGDAREDSTVLRGLRVRVDDRQEVALRAFLRARPHEEVRAGRPSIACRPRCVRFGSASEEEGEDTLAVFRSESIVYEMSPQEDPIYQFDMEIPMRLNHSGEYVVVVALDMDLPDAPTSTRIDMSNTVQPATLISFQNAPEILTVSQGIRYGAYVVVAIAGSILLWLLIQTILHRDHVSLKMGQANFLMAFLLAGLSAVCCSVAS